MQRCKVCDTSYITPDNKCPVCSQTNKDKMAVVIMRNIAERLDDRGHFIEKFARMFTSATDKQKELLLPSAHKLIEAYDIEKGQREKGVLHEAQYS